MFLQTNQFIKYTDGNPISHQMWNNYLIKNQQLEITKITKDKEVHIAQNEIHPDLTSGKNCVTHANCCFD